MRQKKQRRLHSEQGLTLIEVIIAVAILAATVMSSFAVYSQCIVEIRRAKNKTIATNLAQMMMEMISSSPYPVASYHELTSAADPSPQNPAYHDLLVWKANVETFPTSAIGSISVEDDPSFHVVTIEIRYDDYGKTTTSILSLRLDKKIRE